MKNQILTLVLASAFLFSCETKKEESMTETANKEAADEHNAKNSLDILGTYKGVLPCADCEGIQTEITLLADETYTKKTKYLGKDEKPIEEMGDYTWKDGNVLILEGIDTEPVEYLVTENSLMQLDMQGNQSTAGDISDKYILKK